MADLFPEQLNTLSKETLIFMVTSLKTQLDSLQVQLDA